MSWVRFTEKFRWYPAQFNRQVVIVHQPGIRLVNSECAKAAIDAGKAVRSSSPRQEARNGNEVVGRET